MQFCASLLRYIAVVHPLHYSSMMTPRVSNLMICAVWTHATIIGLGPFYCGIWPEGQDQCVFNEVMPPTYILTVFTGQFSLFVTVILCLYMKIFYVANQQKKKIHAAEFGGGNGRHTVKEAKTLKTLVIVLGVFLVSWAPVIVTATLRALGFDGEEVYLMYLLTVLMAILNSALNPVIYCWRSSEFRVVYRNLWRKIYRK